jgi:hypothetical protein
MIIKHTLHDLENTNELQKIIINNKFDIRIEKEYDFEETGTATLIGNKKDVKKLIESNF